MHYHPYQQHCSKVQGYTISPIWYRFLATTFLDGWPKLKLHDARITRVHTSNGSQGQDPILFLGGIAFLLVRVIIKLLTLFCSQGLTGSLSDQILQETSLQHHNTAESLPSLFVSWRTFQNPNSMALQELSDMQ